MFDHLFLYNNQIFYCFSSYYCLPDLIQQNNMQIKFIYLYTKYTEYHIVMLYIIIYF